MIKLFSIIDEIVEIFIVTDNMVLKKFPGDNFFFKKFCKKIQKYSAIFDFIENYYVDKKRKKN